MAIEPFIDLEEDCESGEDSDFDPRSKDCFANFAQLPDPTPNLNVLIMAIVNKMHGNREDVMASPKILVARSQHLGGLRAWVVGSSSMTQSYNHNGLSSTHNAN